MRQIILVFLSMTVFSCHNDFHSPTDKEIEQAVRNEYNKRNGADGGGGWKVTDVQVLKSWKGDDERHYNAEVVVKGVHKAPPLATPKPDEDIDETRQIQLTWRDGQWIGDDK